MALQGSYTFKGIVLSEAYCMVDNLTYNKNYNVSQNQVSAATYNADGSIENEAVYENVYTPVLNASFSVKIYKDSSTKTSNPYDVVVASGYSFTPTLADDADNFVAQAYAYLKTLDEFDGYTDV